jgi:hypothetical protein
MANKKYFKNNPAATVFYDTETGLYLVNEKPSLLEDYHPGKHKTIAEAVRVGRIVEVTEKEYLESLELSEVPKNKKKAKIVEVEGETEGTDMGEPTEEETETSPLDALTSKEALITWAEEQPFITEDELNEAKKLKKAKEVRAYLQELWDFDQESSETE